MADMRHVYVTAHGGYPSGSWAGESAQIGVRLAFASALSAPSMGDIWTPQTNGEIVQTFGSETGTHGTLAKTWTARVGPPGSEQNCDAGAQIDFAEDFWSFLNVIKQYQHSDFKWTHVKCAAVDTTGKIPVVSSVYTFTAPLPGSAGNPLPPQIAMALSTRANLVGRRGRGRVYIPALSTSVLASDGTIAVSAANTMRAAFKTLIDALQAQPGSPLFIPILFVGSHDSPTVVRPVELRTGSRLDTIQSRRRQVVEAYTTTAL